MLGDVSASATGPNALGRITLAYGQVMTAGRLMGTELKQFTEAGVPIIENLAEVMHKPKDEIKELVEEGKVGFSDVVKAFKAMTEGGGKFSGMTSRLATSWKGMREQLGDAVDRAKTKFGTILIEELGLKDGSRDLGNFIGRIEAGMDRIRPAVHMLGDLGRAAVNVGYELGAAAVKFADIQFTALGKAFPDLVPDVEKVKKVIEDLKNFEVDPVNLTAVALDFSKKLLVGVRYVWDALKLAWDDADAAFFSKVKETALEVKSIVGDIKATVDAIKGGANNVREFRDTPAGKALQYTAPAPALGMYYLGKGEEKREKEQQKAAAEAAKPQTPEAIRADRVESMRALRERIAKAEEEGNESLANTGRQLADAMVQRWEEEDRAANRPKMFDKHDPDAIAKEVASAKPVVKPDKATAGFDKMIAGFDEFSRQMMDSARASKEEAASRRKAAESEKELAHARESLISKFDAHAAIAGVGLAAAGKAALDTADKFGRVELPAGEIPADIRELAKKLNHEYPDPVEQFRKETAQVAEALQRGLIPMEVADRATVDIAKKFTKDTARVELPTPAEFGSKEAASLIIQAQYGQKSDTELLAETVRLLGLIKSANVDLATEIMEFAQRITPLPP
jgi:tape measure domain-containing protein